MGKPCSLTRCSRGVKLAIRVWTAPPPRTVKASTANGSVERQASRSALPFGEVGEDVVQREDHPGLGGKAIRVWRSLLGLHDPAPARGLVIGDRGGATFGQILDAADRPAGGEQRHLAWVHLGREFACRALPFRRRGAGVEAWSQGYGTHDQASVATE